MNLNLISEYDSKEFDKEYKDSQREDWIERFKCKKWYHENIEIGDLYLKIILTHRFVDKI